MVSFYGKSFRRVSLSSVIMVIIGGVIFIATMMNFAYAFHSFRNRQIHFIRELSIGVNGLKGMSDKDEMTANTVVHLRPRVQFPGHEEITIADSGLKNLPRYELIKTLRELSLIPREEKQQTVVYIPKSRAWFWKSMSWCKTVPFLIPAITGMAMLDGIPEDDCKTSSYGYETYRKLNHKSLEGATDEAICRQAQSKGFSNVVTLDIDNRGVLMPIRLQCQNF